MNSLFKFFDNYSLRARLFPALLAMAPAFAALALLISWKTFELSNAIASVAISVFLFAMADLARKRGLAIEQNIYKEMGGMPSITMFRRSDVTVEEHAKEQYRQFLASKLKRAAPTIEEETANSTAGDSFYDQASIWLRTNTRDAKKFPILWDELVTYGFRRNQLGLKWPGLLTNLVVVLICSLLLWQKHSLNMRDDIFSRTIVVLIVAAIHAAYFLFAVTRDGVKEASRRYARELILSCQLLMTSTPRRKRPKSEQNSDV